MLFSVYNCYASNDTDYIELTSNSQNIQYGKTFYINLRLSKSNNLNINELLKPLTRVVKYEIIEKQVSAMYIQYTIRCHPLQEGEIIIPVLKWNNSETRPLVINVLPAVSRDKKAIHLKQENANSTPWEREQVTLLVTLFTSDKNIILNRKNIVRAGIKSYPLLQSTSKTEVNGKNIYKHTIGWSVFFLYQQKTHLELPRIEYVKDGVPLYKFNFKSITFNIKKLPVYINPKTVVGKLRLVTHYKDDSKLFLQPNNTSIIHYDLISSNIPAKWLPSISQHYNRLQSKGITYSHIGTDTSTNINTESIQGIKSTDIAFTPLSNGIANIDDINIQYFDPAEGKLKNLVTKHKKVIVLNWFVQLLIYLISAIVLYVLVRYSILFIRKKYAFFKYYQLCFQALSSAEDFLELKLSLSYASLAEGWQENTTIFKWLELFNKKYKQNTQLEKNLGKMNYSLYSKGYSGEDFNQIKGNILTGIKRRTKK